MKCPNCNKHEAQTHLQYGVLPCRACTNRLRGSVKTTQPTEFTTEEIRDQRKELKRDTIQPWRDGKLSLEYVEEYGTKNIVVDDERDLKNVGYVWDEDDYYGRN